MLCLATEKKIVSESKKCWKFIKIISQNTFWNKSSVSSSCLLLESSASSMTKFAFRYKPEKNFAISNFFLYWLKNLFILLFFLSSFPLSCANKNFFYTHRCSLTFSFQINARKKYLTNIFLKYICLLGRNVFFTILCLLIKLQII